MTAVTRVAFRTALRAAAVELLTSFSNDVGIRLQVYPARPRTIAAPCAFLDVVREAYAYSNVTWRTRTAQAEIVVVHGLFDSKEAVDAADRFADAFVDWTTDRYHAAGPNTIVQVRELEDDPAYLPEWLPPGEQKTYYATRIVLEGFAGG